MFINAPSSSWADRFPSHRFASIREGVLIFGGRLYCPQTPTAVSLETQLAHRGVHEGLGREKKKQVKEKIIKLGSDLKN
jgi:hypothetical protein